MPNNLFFKPLCVNKIYLILHLYAGKITKSFGKTALLPLTRSLFNTPQRRKRNPIMAQITLDKTDLKILQVLQNNGRLTNVELSERVALSP